MSREIKFRAWDNEENKYFKPTYEAYKGNLKDLSIGLGGRVIRRTLEMPAEDESMFKNRYLLEQFTGLTDKNGVEIYEGDIVKWVGMVDYNYEVVFKKGSYYTAHINKSLGDWGLLSDMYRPDIVECFDEGFEVIGNIHETK